MNFTIQQTEGIQLTGSMIGNTINVDYTALLYEQPASNNAFLSLWQNTQVPFGRPGDTTKNITGNQRTGSQSFNISVTEVPYIVGWGAGSVPNSSDPDYNSIGASVTFTPGVEDKAGIITGVSQQCQIQPALVGTNSIVVQFITLNGHNPQQSKDWIGLWLGSTLDFGGNFLQQWNVTSSVSQDSQGLNTNQQVMVGTTYTLAYATGPRVSDIVARCTFQTSGY